MLNNSKLEWTSFPFIERPKTSILVVSFIIFIAVIMWYIAVISWDMPIFYVIGVIAFTFDLLPYFIPTSYQFNDEKIVITYWLIKIERKYSDFRCFYADKRGVMLSTFTKPGRLDRFRGQSIRFSKSAEEKEPLYKLLKERIGKQY